MKKPHSYVINNHLASTGMSTIYNAVDQNGRRYAIKEISNSSRTTGPLTKKISEEETRELIRTFFGEERALLKRIKHPSIVGYVDDFERDGKSFLVMPYIEGKTLENLVEEKKTGLPFEDSVNYVLQIADALDYLHKWDVVYSDLSAKNVMVDSKGKVTLIDFGISQPSSGKSEKAGWGTVGYSAPERYKGKCSIKSDIYSLGILFKYVLSGEKPIANSLNWHPKLSIDSNLEQCINKACSYDFRDRYSTVREFVKDIRQETITKKERTPNKIFSAIKSYVDKNIVPFIYNNSENSIIGIANNVYGDAGFQGIAVITNVADGDVSFQGIAVIANAAGGDAEVQGIAGMANVASNELHRFQLFAPVSYAKKMTDAWQGGVVTVAEEGKGKQYGLLCFGPNTEWWNPAVCYNEFGNEEKEENWIERIKPWYEKAAPTFTKLYGNIFCRKERAPPVLKNDMVKEEKEI